MKKLLSILFIISAICASAQGNHATISNPQTIGQTGRNQAVSKGLIVPDSAIFNSKVFINLHNNAALDSVLTTDSTGKLVFVKVTGGGGSGPLSQHQIGFGDSSNNLSGSNEFKFTPSIENGGVAKVEIQSASGVTKIAAGFITIGSSTGGGFSIAAPAVSTGATLYQWMGKTPPDNQHNWYAKCDSVGNMVWDTVHITIPPTNPNDTINVYNSNGTLTSNRTISLGTRSFKIQDPSGDAAINLSSNGGVNIGSKTVGIFFYTSQPSGFFDTLGNPKFINDPTTSSLWAFDYPNTRDDGPLSGPIVNVLATDGSGMVLSYPVDSILVHASVPSLQAVLDKSNTATGKNIELTSGSLLLNSMTISSATSGLLDYGFTVAYPSGQAGIQADSAGNFAIYSLASGQSTFNVDHLGNISATNQQNQKVTFSAGAGNFAFGDVSGNAGILYNYSMTGARQRNLVDTANPSGITYEVLSANGIYAGPDGNINLDTSTSTGLATKNYVQNSITSEIDTLFGSGSGSDVVVTFPHGRSYTPSWIEVNADNDAANVSNFRWTVDATNITLTYTMFLPLGTNNLAYVIKFFK